MQTPVKYKPTVTQVNSQDEYKVKPVLPFERFGKIGYRPSVTAASTGVDEDSQRWQFHLWLRSDTIRTFCHC